MSLTGLHTWMRSDRRARPRAYAVVVLVCLALLALLTVVQVAHVHSVDTDADHCPLVHRSAHRGAGCSVARGHRPRPDRSCRPGRRGSAGHEASGTPAFHPSSSAVSTASFSTSSSGHDASTEIAHFRARNFRSPLADLDPNDAAVALTTPCASSHGLRSFSQPFGGFIYAVHFAATFFAYFPSRPFSCVPLPRPRHKAAMPALFAAPSPILRAPSFPAQPSPHQLRQRTGPHRDDRRHRPVRNRQRPLQQLPA